jgi:hypothetical protein
VERDRDRDDALFGGDRTCRGRVASDPAADRIDAHRVQSSRGIFPFGASAMPA